MNESTSYNITKRCTMCGEEKPITEFRTQTQRRRGLDGVVTYTRPYCKVCESIEVRRQYLLSLANLTPDQQQELSQISELYGLRLSNGLKTFGTRKRSSGKAATQHIQDQLTKLRGVKAEHGSEG